LVNYQVLHRFSGDDGEIFHPSGSLQKRTGLPVYRPLASYDAPENNRSHIKILSTSLSRIEGSRVRSLVVTKANDLFIIDLNNEIIINKKGSGKIWQDLYESSTLAQYIT